ncbi:MAG TPA: DsbA family oxidoreductase [Acidimicrobiales bacterium]|nr:DsbA family oxidoreductase [Acidimicrobiales bacterium]
MAEPVKIDVWSDIACPWCYIGKRRLEAGLAAAAAPVEVEYRSFELAPDTPVDFQGSAVDFLVRHKRMSEAQVRSLIERVTQVAAGEGLDYDFDRVRHTNTVKAHQLLHFAKARGLQHEAKERLLRAYFVEGRHIGRTEELVLLAAEVGLDADDVRRSLEGDEYLHAVRTDERAATAYGISAVPFFVIDGRYGVPGAQSAETFAQAITRAAAEREAA